MVSSSGLSRTPPEHSEKAVESQIENVPDHPDYYEKGGLRTYDDDMDHDYELPYSNSIYMQIIKSWLSTA